MLKKKVILYGLLLNVNNNYMMESKSGNTLKDIYTQMCENVLLKVKILRKIKKLQEEVAGREGRIIVKYNELLTLYKFYEKDFHDTSLPQTLEKTFSNVEKKLLPKIDKLLLKKINFSCKFEKFALELTNFINECDKTIACDLHGPLVMLEKWHTLSGILAQFTKLLNEQSQEREIFEKNIKNITKDQCVLKQYITTLNFRTMCDTEQKLQKAQSTIVKIDSMLKTMKLILEIHEEPEKKQN